MEKESVKSNNLFKYILALFLFGTTGVASRGLTISGFEVALYRSFFGTLFLFILFILLKKKFEIFKYKSDMLGIILSGASLGLNWVFLFESYDNLGVSLSVLIYYLGPAIVMIVSPILFKEKMTIIKIVGFLIVLLGIYLVNFVGNIGNVSGIGLFLAILSAIFYACLLIFNRLIKKVSGLESTLFQMLVAFITILIYKIYSDGFSINIKESDLPQILYLGIICTGIGCYLYYSTINKLKVQTVCICGYIDPVSALIFSAIFIGEKITGIQMVGAFLIIFGVLMTELLSLKTKNKKRKNI